MELSVNRTVGFLGGLASFFELSFGTVIGSFLSWIGLSSVLNFVHAYYPYIMAGVLTLLFIKRTRNVYILGGIYVLLMLFLVFILKL